MGSAPAVSGGPGSQLVPFEVEEVSQHRHRSVPLQKPDSLGQEPFLFWVPTAQEGRDWAVWASEPVGRISARCRGVGGRLRVGAVGRGRRGGGTSHFPFCHTRSIVYHAAQRKLFIGKSSLFSTGNVPPPRLGNVAGETQGLVAGEAGKDTMREVRDKPPSKRCVRSWTRKSKRILSTGVLAQLTRRLQNNPPHLPLHGGPLLPEALSTSNYLLVPFSEEAGGIRRLKCHHLICAGFTLLSFPRFLSSVGDYRQEGCCHLHLYFGLMENPQSPEGGKQEGKTETDKVPCPLWVT